ncbi:MAG TPA: ABC transporter permease [bacterium]|nr:ABC transporter permease [bacterium]
MNVKRLFKVAVQSIWKNKMRTLLTMLGIIIGVGAVIVMIALGEGARSQIQDRVNSLGTNIIVVTPGASTQGGISRGAQSFNRLTVDDAESIRKQALSVARISPVIVAPTQAVGGEGNWRSVVFGVHTDYQFIRDWTVESGRFFDESEMRSMRKVALLGKTVADALFPGQDPVGQQIRLRDQPFEIIGVMAHKGQTAEGTDQDDVVLAPYTTVRTRLSGRQFIAQIIASASSPQDLSFAQTEITQIMRDSHHLAEWEESDFTVRNQTDIANTAKETTEIMTMLLAIIAGISLIVGGIGIMNIMLVSVTERTREIGIRMAVGARSSDVLTQFLVESIAMSFLGGAIGVVVGFAGAAILKKATGWTVEVSAPAILLALLFSAGVGIFFGFHPARRAASLNPIEALRHE